MKYYTIGEFSKLVGRSIQTLRLWDKEGKLKSHHRTEGGHRYYSEQQINQYCRVSSNKQKDDLERQIGNVKTYMIKELLEDGENQCSRRLYTKNI